MLPSGTLTFLFTDIEGSTQRWDRDRAAMQDAVRRHDAILRDAVASSGGTVFKTIGDAFCAVFARPEEAVAAILTSQRALAREDFSAVDGVRVRMALHTGTADERDGDYYGPALNRVARLLAIGHGGQMLLSRLTADLVRDALPGGVTLGELGLHKLKDLAEPELVHQLIAPDLPHEFPPLRSTGAVPNNLPAETSSFVGRETELAEVPAALRDARIVTLLGMGGIGKTRLSLQVAAGELDRFPNGVWFVEFAATTDPALVAETIASTIGVAEAPGRPPLETLVAHLKHDHALLILDNCEHLIGDVARTADAIVRACPKVRILASSREPLGVAGEVAYRLPTLAIAEAVALFAARATAANRQFALAPENEQVVTEICRRLDGIALAIELAAARVKTMSVKALLEKLDDRFRVVAGGSRTALPRQQTLRALIDWSYDLLSERERTLFRRLAIFAGGFTLESCIAVCACDPLDEFEVADLLSALVDKSLVHAEIADDETRYGLLESIREYAREKLADGGEFEAVAGAHALAYATLAEELDADLDRSDASWATIGKPELENWRAALNRTFANGGDVILGQRIAASLRSLWVMYALAEGMRWVSKGLDRVDEITPALLKSKLQLARSHLAIPMVNHRLAMQSARNALDLCGDDERQRGLSHLYLGAALGSTGHSDDAEEHLNVARAAFERLGVKRPLAGVLQYLAHAKYMAGDMGAAKPALAEALALFRATGADHAAAAIAANLAEFEYLTGDAATALNLAIGNLEIDRSRGDENAVAFGLCNVASYFIALDRFEEGRTAALDALRLALDRELEAAAYASLTHLASVAALGSDNDQSLMVRSAKILGFVDATLERLGTTREPSEQLEYDRVLQRLHSELGDALPKWLDEGRSWDEARAVAAATEER